MERINLPKSSITKDIILSGFEAEGFTLAKRTNNISTPIYLYYNNSLKKVAIFRCGISTDELIIVGYESPAKLQIIVDEYNTFNDNFRNEITEILKQIISGSYFEDNYEVKYL